MNPQGQKKSINQGRNDFLLTVALVKSEKIQYHSYLKGHLSCQCKVNLFLLHLDHAVHHDATPFECFEFPIFRQITS
jgi:hypothetical protein